MREEFGTAHLGDERLNRRLQAVAANLARDPGWSIPHASGGWPATKATYRFCDNESVTREKVMEAHVESTRGRVQEESVILVVEDTSFLNYTHHPKLEGVGKIGARKYPNQLKGVLLHTALAVTPETHRVLGVLDQEVIIREKYQKPGETAAQKRKRSRESEKWMSSARRVIGKLPTAERVIFVFDREGDIFEAIEELQDFGGRFVIRAALNRRIESDGKDRAYLFDTVRSEPILGIKEETIPAGGGRKERVATVSLRVGTYRLMPPKGRDRSGESRQVNVVSAVEEDPPEGVDPVAWLLLTSEPVSNREEALTVLSHYCGRWKIEEWFKALKTGCRIEQRQLEKWDRLEVLLGIYSVIAWRLLSLRDAARSDDTWPEEETLTSSQRTILKRMDTSLRSGDGPRAYLRAIAKLGGFLGRKRDGDPGWITLWRGFSRLRDIEVGYDLHAGAEGCG